ncbi:MAG: transglutaminase family protein [Capsulimonadaceae bacterium]
MDLHIAHKTIYRYSPTFSGESHMEARLRPLEIAGEQQCRDFGLTVNPVAPVYGYDMAGHYGYVSHFTIKDILHDELEIVADSWVRTLNANPFDKVNLVEPDWDKLRDEKLQGALAEWLAPTPLTWYLDEWSVKPPNESVFDYGQALMDCVYEGFDYVPGSTDVSTPLDQFVKQRRGVCQDYAHFMISIARTAGVPARYVSGYVYSGLGRATHGEGAMHAWVELFIPHANCWMGYDPTNNIVVGDYHVKVAVGRDYSDVPPTKGVLRASRGSGLPEQTSLTVEVRVTEEPFD